MYAAKRQWFAVVTGNCGTGKTTILRTLVGELQKSEYKLLYVGDSKLTLRHFYKGMLEQLGCEARFYRGDAKRQLHREMELLRGMHQVQPVVVVDEAHLLERKMLEEVRFLLNFRMDAQSPMALVLVGQTELWERLRLQTYAAIRQRMDLQCKLPHYDRAQSAAYLKQHLRYAGTQQEIFSDAAVEEMYRYAGGTARMLNQVATHSLIYGAQNKRRIIDSSSLEENCHEAAMVTHDL